MPRAEPLLDEERGSGGVAPPSGCLERELRSPRVPLACVAFLGVFALVTTFAGGSSDSGAGANGAPPPPPPPPSGPRKTVLVFGDSWGDVGPTWHQIEDTFANHSVPVIVRNAAIGGTRACQWDSGSVHNQRWPKGQALASEAFRLFPETEGKVDFVWYTAGGNDPIADQVYKDCESAIGGSTPTNYHADPQLYEAHLECMQAMMTRVDDCTKSLLGGLFEQSPETRVVQCGYDLPALIGANCMAQAAARAPFCGSSVECAVKSLWDLQEMFFTPLEREFNTGATQKYTGLNIVGAIQEATGQYGPKGCGADDQAEPCRTATIGNPLRDRGSEKEYMTSCVHPTYPGKGAQAVGEALWDKFFSKHV